jgi:hypothetical protein
LSLCVDPPHHLHPGDTWRTGKMAKNVTCKYRITATVKADTNYELEVIKANLD